MKLQPISFSKTILYISFLGLSACGSTPIVKDTEPTNSQVQLSKESNFEIDKFADRVGKSILQIDPLLSLQSLEKKEEMGWSTYPLDIEFNKAFVDPGQYRYRVSAKSMAGTISSVIDIKPDSEDHYIHYLVGPTRENIYVWPSNTSKRDERFYDEKLNKFCTVGKKTYGHTAFSQNLPDYAFDACKDLAAKGKPAGLIQMGLFSESGQFGTSSSSAALDYYRQAYEKGELTAGRNLMFLYSKLGKQEQLLSLAKKLAEEGDVYAMSQLAVLRSSPFEGEADFDDAIYWATQSAKAGNPSGFRLLMNFNLRKNSFNPDFASAAAWLREYQRRFHISNNSSAYFALEMEIKAETRDLDVNRQVAEVEKTLNESENVFTGEICLSDLHLNPEYAGMKLEYKINALDQFFPISKTEPTLIRNLSPSGSARLEIYADALLYSPETVRFADESAEKMCLYFDPESGFNRLISTDIQAHCGC